MKKRERMISILVRRAGGMRTMLLTGLIESFPRYVTGIDGGTDTKGAWFAPAHSDLQRRMKINPPVYWTLLRGLCDRGLVHKRVTDEKGHEYQIDFGAIEAFCQYGRLEMFVRSIKHAMGRK